MATGDIIGTPYVGTHTLGNWQSDDAYDISTPVGTHILAAGNGVVTKVSPHPQDGTRFAGDQITIHLDDGNDVFYTHGVTGVKVGQRVKAGEAIGTTGSANGLAHLHFAARRDPQQYLDDVLGGSRGGNIVKDAAGDVLDAAGNVIDKVTGKAADAATGVAADVAKAAVKSIWGAVGDDGARALLYAVLVFGGTGLALAGIARATGVGQLAKDVQAKGQEAALLVATKGAV